MYARNSLKDFTIHIDSTPTFLYFDCMDCVSCFNTIWFDVNEGTVFKGSPLRKVNTGSDQIWQISNWSNTKRMQLNVAESNDPYLTTDHSLDLGVDFTEEGKPENQETNPQNMGEPNATTTTLLIWIPNWRINTKRYHAGGRGHPAITQSNQA